MNAFSAPQCTDCSMPFSNLPRSAFVDDREGRSYGHPPGINDRPSLQKGYLRTEWQDTPGSRTGENTFFWYRMYCGSLALLYVLVAAFGGFMAFLRPDTREYSSEETMIMGIIYALIGAVFFVVFLVALLLPAKPYNWVVGIVMIGIGMTSCCLWPAVIPLLIYWIKPETRSFFGRN